VEELPYNDCPVVTARSDIELFWRYGLMIAFHRKPGSCETIEPPKLRSSTKLPLKSRSFGGFSGVLTAVDGEWPLVVGGDVPIVVEVRWQSELSICDLLIVAPGCDAPNMAL
jgi:hypothetical protein